MVTLCAVLCRDAGGASIISDQIRGLTGGGSLALLDAATVTWSVGQHRPDFQDVPGLTKSSPMGDDFWHLLLGHVFLWPIAAAASGRPVRAAYSSLASLGFLDDFVDAARRRVRPGSSALFLMTDDVTVDRLLELLPQMEFTVTSTSLSNRQLQGLRRAFAQTSSAQ